METHSPFTTVLESRVVLPGKTYEKNHWDYSEEEYYDKQYGLKQEDVASLDARLLALPLGQLGIRALQSLIKTKSFHIQPALAFLEQGCSQRFATLSRILFGRVVTLDKFIAYYATLKKEAPEHMFIQKTIFCPEEITLDERHPSALRLARNILRAKKIDGGEKFELVSEVLRANPLPRAARIAQHTLAWCHKDWRGHEEFRHVTSALHLFSEQDLSKKEYAFVVSRLPKIDKANKLGFFQNWEVGHAHVPVYGFTRAYILTRMLNILGGRVTNYIDDHGRYNEYRDARLTWPGRRTNDLGDAIEDISVEEILMTRGALDKQGFPHATPTRRKRNRLFLMQQIFDSGMGSFILRDGLERDIGCFSGASRRVLELFTNELARNEKDTRHQKNAGAILTELDYLLTHSNAQLAAIRELQSRGCILCDTRTRHDHPDRYHAKAYAESTPAVRKFLLPLFDPEHIWTFDRAIACLHALAQPDISREITLLTTGAPTELPQHKRIPFLQQIMARDPEQGLNTFYYFLETRKALAKNPQLIPFIADMSGLTLPEPIPAHLLTHVRTRYGADSFNYLNCVTNNAFAALADLPPTLRAFARQALATWDPHIPSYQYVGLFSNIGKLNGLPQDIIDILGNIAVTDAETPRVAFVSEFYKSFTNLPHSTRASIITRLLREKSYSIMQDLHNNEINNANIETYLATLPEVPTVGLAGLVSLLVTLNRLSARLNALKSYTDAKSSTVLKRYDDLLSLSSLEEVINRTKPCRIADFPDITAFVDAYEKRQQELSLPQFDYDRLGTLLLSYGAFDSSTIFEQRIANPDAPRDRSLTGVLRTLDLASCAHPQRVVRRIVRDFFETLEARRDIARYRTFRNAINNIYLTALEGIIDRSIDSSSFICSDHLENVVIGFLSPRCVGKIQTVMRGLITEYVTGYIAATQAYMTQKQAHGAGNRRMTQAMRKLEGNKRLVKLYKQRGINVPFWQGNYTHMFTVAPIQDPEAFKQELRKKELEHIRRCLTELGWEGQMQDDVLARELQKIIEQPRIKHGDELMVAELYSHVDNFHRAHSLNTALAGTVRFIMSTDHFLNHNMGTIFRSCTSLTSVNGYSAFVTDVDMNKRVAYAVFTDGLQERYVGRNLIELTPDGIIPNEFFRAHGITLDREWVTFLHQFSIGVEHPLLLPLKFLSPEMMEHARSLGYRQREVKTILERGVFPTYYHNGFAGNIKFGETDSQPFSFTALALP